ncbi:hypothetical protein ABZT29_24445 [Streptomyces prasinus]
MNALATDQAGRIGDYLAQPELAQVTAGLYIGDKPDTDFRRVMTRREEMRQSPPDVLITNYKMLDLLLQRAEDRPLSAVTCPRADRPAGSATVTDRADPVNQPRARVEDPPGT